MSAATSPACGGDEVVSRRLPVRALGKREREEVRAGVRRGRSLAGVLAARLDTGTAASAGCGSKQPFGHGASRLPWCHAQNRVKRGVRPTQVRRPINANM